MTALPSDPAPLELRPLDLIARWRERCSLFVSPRQSVLAHGMRAALPHCEAEALPARVQSLLQGAQAEGVVRPMVIGAVPYRLDRPAHLFMPGSCLLGAGASPSALVPAGPLSQAAAELAVLSQQPPARSYTTNVTRALDAMAQGELQKVVLSRSVSVRARPDMPSLLRRLAERNAHGYTFALDLPAGSLEPPRTLVGASPELLLSRVGRWLSTNPLAGSIPRSVDPAEDRRRAEGLLHSEKDLREHAVVAEVVAEALRPLCRRLHVPRAPSVIATPTMWHLSTRITGELADTQLSSLALALKLHPTPAVCGHPLNAARDFIERHEGFDRGFFTGMVGWCDAWGDGEWAIALRCAELQGDTATLYAGAGIVTGSVPEHELQETDAKMRTLLNALAPLPLREAAL
ncbi:isochorismate synthase [Aquabacterium sp. A7-Y]|uniref:isochorismate synthase n=1 Tax=Aquabacterium sp. A7-Y TaxID=1349605 RepID=UPI00223E32D4|nr:isochorismate synthase [Aquabacterium sp. A7-Y]MCW7539438.1 isochorismate synthase [Aquabacterium sp. A7-Y]